MNVTKRKWILGISFSVYALHLKLLAVNKSVCLDQNIVITIITFLSVTNVIS